MIDFSALSNRCAASFAKRALVVAFAFVIVLRLDARAGDAPRIVPLPRQVTVIRGAYVLPPLVTVGAADAPSRSVAAVLVDYLRRRGVRTSEATRAERADVRLSSTANEARLGNEGYRLSVDLSGITIRANAAAGLFYGVQTFKQLAGEGRPLRSVGAAKIVDWPEYAWRGVHLDVSRHFFPVPVVERVIDLAARYKLNTLHWHLTDDQGWRIPIARYPKLTQIGGCRAGTQVGSEGSTLTDGKPYCGSYTPQQIREVVAFARARYVTVVPEIEMPGHSVEALAAYPWLGCGPGPYRVRELWGVETNILCPTERTFAFVSDVLAETAALFPGTYVHIGGDEVPKDAWRTSAAVAALRARQHLPNLESVQGYFTRRVERIARARQRRIIGWDDIVAGGVSSSATVMAWHGPQAAIDAIHRGHDVIVTPDPPFYFDAYQGDPRYEPVAIGGLTTLEMVYAYDPMPPGLSQGERRHVLGAQGNVWTEYIPTAAQLFYMLFPRELALAEICWTPHSAMRWDDFQNRAGAELQRLDALHQPYRIPNVTFTFPKGGGGEATYRADTFVALRELTPDASIHYTLDGTLPTAASPTYARPFHVSASNDSPVTLTAVAVLFGRSSAPSSLRLGAKAP